VGVGLWSGPVNRWAGGAESVGVIVRVATVIPRAICETTCRVGAAITVAVAEVRGTGTVAAKPRVAALTISVKMPPTAVQVRSSDVSPSLRPS
jgi:hypothetical protein